MQYFLSAMMDLPCVGLSCEKEIKSLCMLIKCWLILLFETSLWKIRWSSINTFHKPWGVWQCTDIARIIIQQLASGADREKSAVQESRAGGPPPLTCAGFCVLFLLKLIWYNSNSKKHYKNYTLFYNNIKK